MPKGRKERTGVNIEVEQRTWLDKNFDGLSSGVRKCIEIAQRVYEKGDDKEKVKFIIGEEES